jgi:hypothetical protein
LSSCRPWSRSDLGQSWLARRGQAAGEGAAEPPGRCETGDAAEARDQYASLLPMQERVLGPDHANTLTTRGNLADWTEKAEAGARPNVN